MLLLQLTSNDARIKHTTFLTAESTLQPEGLLHTRGMAASGLRPLCNPTAASRRSLGRVSVPVWLIILSDSPEAFVPHAVLLRQAFAHCGKFLTAASRRSLDRVSVPVWLIILSDQLGIVALVSPYLTN